MAEKAPERRGSLKDSRAYSFLYSILLRADSELKASGNSRRRAHIDTNEKGNTPAAVVRGVHRRGMHGCANTRPPERTLERSQSSRNEHAAGTSTPPERARRLSDHAARARTLPERASRQPGRSSTSQARARRRKRLAVGGPSLPVTEHEIGPSKSTGKRSSAKAVSAKPMSAKPKSA